MIMSPGIYSFLFAFLGFTFLTILLIASARHKTHGKRLILASAASAVWSFQIMASEYLIDNSSILTSLFEWLRYMFWFLFLGGLMSVGWDSKGDQPLESVAKHQRKRDLFKLIIIPAVAIMSLIATSLPELQILTNTYLFSEPTRIQIVTLILLTIVGLGFIEQIIRNSSHEQRWVIKYLCVGLGSIFSYDFYMYSEGLLFQEINPQLWQARGFINAFAIPLIAISAARHNSLNLGIHVSRHVIFQSTTALGAGIYLLVMSAAGYYVRYIGGAWGNLFQILFLFGSGLILAALLFSNKLRMNLKVFLNKHFYSYKYDYRQQWLEFTHNLANNTAGEIPDRSCQAIAGLMHGSGALLWCKNQHQKYELLSHWHIPEPEIDNATLQSDLESLDQFLERTLWVIDFDELNNDTSKYTGLNLPQWITNIPKVWLITPLILQNKILGFILLKKSDISGRLNWEDRDLLKMAGQQAAIHLAQYRSEMALIEARQFEAYNRLSTYVMHDLKNILAQQSLIISNAEKHRHKQEFVDDVLRTIENSVDRMTRLLGQMKRGLRSESDSLIKVSVLLGQVIAESSVRKPIPTLSVSTQEFSVKADSAQLKNVFGHLIQNAQEATPDHGTVHIDVSCTEGQSRITVNDTGHGMTPEFIKDRLFKPFDSTKGLMGMGIGAYESRQYILSLGGDIQVSSAEGEGSQFNITLPNHLTHTPSDSTDLSELRKNEENTKNDQSAGTTAHSLMIQRSSL